MGHRIPTSSSSSITQLSLFGQSKKLDIRQAVKAAEESPDLARQRDVLAAWQCRPALADLPDWESRRLHDDPNVDIVHIEFAPTSKGTRRWIGFAVAYGYRFQVSLWQEDIDFLLKRTGQALSLPPDHWTPELPWEVMLKKYSKTWGWSGIAALWIEGELVYAGVAPTPNPSPSHGEGSSEQQGQAGAESVRAAQAHSDVRHLRRQDSDYRQELDGETVTLEEVLASGGMYVKWQARARFDGRVVVFQVYAEHARLLKRAGYPLLKHGSTPVLADVVLGWDDGRNDLRIVGVFAVDGTLHTIEEAAR